MENEDRLIRQILLGHSELFESIVLEYQNLVFSVCLSIVINTHEAENMAQETFLTAYKSLSDFRGGSLKSWLCRIAVNKAIDCKRKQSRFVFSEFEESTEQVKTGVEESFERKECNERMRHIVSGLPTGYASVIKAFYYDCLTVKEIARRMELPERTIETRLYRAKKLIRERWSNDRT